MADKRIVTLENRKASYLKKLKLALEAGQKVGTDEKYDIAFARRLDGIKAIYDTLCKTFDELNDLKSVTVEDYIWNSEEEDNVEHMYNEIQFIAAGLALKGQEKQPSTRAARSQPLPTMGLPRFAGELKEWRSFYDRFRSRIHENSEIADVDKFHYLAECLSGPPLAIVEGFPITNANYGVVWEALVKRYQNKRGLASTYMDTLLENGGIVKDTADGLNAFLCSFDKAVSGLRALEISNLEDFAMFHLAKRRLPNSVMKAYEATVDGVDVPTYASLKTFVEKHVSVLERCSGDYKRNQLPLQHAQGSCSKRVLVVESARCRLGCEASHEVSDCPVFLRMQYGQRRSRVEKLSLCFVCLGEHLMRNCLSEEKCADCRGRHHTLLHRPRRQGEAGASVGNRDGRQRDSHTERNLHVSLESQVLLGTALVDVMDASGHYRSARVLMDSCSQSSFITTNLMQRLGLHSRKKTVALTGLAENRVGSARGHVICTVKPRGSGLPLLTTGAIVLPKITADMPTFVVPECVTSQFSSLELADPFYYKSAPIDMLIGADLFPKIYDGRKLELAPDQPSALHSVFGWVIMGRVESSTRSPLSTLVAVCDPLNNLIQKFWETEEVKVEIPEGSDNIRCEEIFVKGHYRNKQGRYVVPLPFRLDGGEFGETRELASKRLRTLVKRLNSKPELKQSYEGFLAEYERLGHMVRVRNVDAGRYYIPHHCVLKENSTSTKLRVVFDASMAGPSGVSLNDALLAGPKLQNDLPLVLTRFRRHLIAFTADIEKMYRQILVRPEDCVYQHILFGEGMNVREYQLQTVTYGLASAPFLAIRVLHQLASDEGGSFPRAADILRNDMYVDDLVSGADSVEEAREVRDNLMAIMRRGGFQLRKWTASHPALLEDLPSDFVESSFDVQSQLQGLNVLGLRWDPVRDQFLFIANVDLNPRVTRRSVLSVIARLFDPLGWIAPVIFKAKRFMQELWRLTSGWDDPLPEELGNRWLNYIGGIADMPALVVPRCIERYRDRRYLVGFSDASELGFAAVIYYVVRGPNGESQTSLLISKTKVAPLKVQTIPRLELCGAALLAKLMKYLRGSSTEFSHLDGVFAFTDSMVVLGWLKTEPRLLKTFVANRVVSTLDAVPDGRWAHVRSEMNPADCASRGLAPAQLAECRLWWSGPEFLAEPVEQWSLDFDQGVEPLPDVKEAAVVLVQTIDSDMEILDRFSSLSAATRITAWCRRFLRNCRVKRGERIIGPLGPSEVDEALGVWVKRVQQAHFGRFIGALAQGEAPPWLAKLRPFVDARGFLRVGGRLGNSSLDMESKHPLLLPKEGHFTRLVVSHAHLVHLHVGPRTVQSLIARKYWIVSARSVIRSVLAKCVRYCRFRARVVQPLMGDLPRPRISVQSRAFVEVGVDYGGPFMVRESRRRNAKQYKAYLCLFVCMASKAVHLELVTDLSVEAMLAALHRFISRRGLCRVIYSDNGTNFVGAARHLSELFKYLSTPKVQEELCHKVGKMNMEWRFIPPSAPHFGGLWEAGIKSVKYHLARSVGEQVLTFEELATLTARVEAILNSRPLCPWSTDPGEADALTPGHLIVGGPLVGVPDCSLRDVPIGRLGRWQLVSATIQSFWKRWQHEYLHTLQQRAKWFNEKPNLEIGQLLLIRDGNLPPTQWRLGRVEELFHGRDGVVRVVNVRTATGVYKRPVHKLCPLPAP